MSRIEIDEADSRSERGGHARISTAEIAARLNDRIADLALELLGEPNKALSSSRQLRYGTKGSLAVEIDGPKCGQWFDHENDVGGDALAMIGRYKGISNSEALDWGRGWLGLPSYTPKNRHPGSEQRKTGDKIDESEDVLASRAEPPGPAAIRAEKVAKIRASCTDIHGTPVERYLRNRGITAVPPACILFRPFAFDNYGAMVALATDDEGQVLALQQVYLTDNGTKAPLAVQKRTNKAVDGWADKSAVRLPGTQPVILAEGIETALSIWQATGRETWACLGISNIARAPVPVGAAVTIARDGDEPDGKADRQIRKAANSLLLRGHPVSLAPPPRGDDFNDVLVKEGTEAVKKFIDLAEPVTLEPGAIVVSIGSDVEIAQRVREDLGERFGRVVHTGGAYWRYGNTHWESILDPELRRAVHRYDGARYFNPVGTPKAVMLSKGRIDSILNECATLSADPCFFEKRPIGINCASGFIRFASDGTPAIETHHRDHRCRHTLPGYWKSGADGRPPNDSLLFRLLDGVFKGDTDAGEKIALLSEIAGSAALGYGTQLLQPRAVILFGQTAENGKSQVLDLARGLLPPNAVCSVPAGRMGDERHIIGLVGKLLNATDELSASAIASDTFKSIVTGEPVEGRDVYRSRVEFRSVAQNLFATNSLPPFHGGMDRGVQRRLLVVPFNRTIPVQDRIENIGRRVAVEEADQLLAWAVEGASRLVRERNFTVPASCKLALADWIFGADPVLAWLDECTAVRSIVDGQPVLVTRTAYEHFRAWAITEGFHRDKLPAINQFTQRVSANAKGVEHKRNKKHGRHFLGLVTVSSAPAMEIPF